MTKSNGNTSRVRSIVLASAVGVLAISNIATFMLMKNDSGVVGEVAKLDGKPITSEEFYKFVVETDGERLLESYVAEKLVALDAEKNKIKVPQEDVDKEIQALVDEYGSEEALEEALKGFNQTREELEEDIITYLETRALLLPRLDVTDEKLQAYFEERKANFEQKEQVRASHILVESEELANRLLNDILGGADWKETALTNSKDYYAEATDADGSDLGYFSRGQMVEEFENVAFEMNAGDQPRIAKSEYGYHIIKVTDKVEYKEAKFDEVREQVELAYLEENSDAAYATWLEEKKTEFKYESLLK